MAIMKESFSDRYYNAVNYVLMTLVLIIVSYPLIFIASASLSDPFYINSGKLWLLPRELTIEGYIRAFQNKDIFIGYKNTIFYTIAGVTINLLVTLPCAYALSRKDFRFRNFFMMLFTFTMFFSGGMIPTYFLIRNLGFLDTVWAVLIPYAASMFNIIIARTYFQSNIPDSLREAARIDGCSILKIFISIVLPLSGPIIIVLILYYGAVHWNSYFSAMIYINKRSLFPLQLFLREILVINEMNSEMMRLGDAADGLDKQAEIMGLIKYVIIVLSSAPLMMGYAFLQRYLVKGIMIGAIKE